MLHLLHYDTSLQLVFLFCQYIHQILLVSNPSWILLHKKKTAILVSFSLLVALGLSLCFVRVVLQLSISNKSRLLTTNCTDTFQFIQSRFSREQTPTEDLPLQRSTSVAEITRKPLQVYSNKTVSKHHMPVTI